MSAKYPQLNPRCAFARHAGKAKLMKKQIILKSFSALSFDGIKITVIPVREMHAPPATPGQAPPRVRDHDRPVTVRAFVNSVNAPTALREIWNHTLVSDDPKGQRPANKTGALAPPVPIQFRPCHD